MTITNNGRPFIKLTMPAVTAVSSVLGIFIFLAGWSMSYLTFKADMAVSIQNLAELKGTTQKLHERVSMLENRTIVIEQNVIYIVKNVNDITLAVVPKR